MSKPVEFGKGVETGYNQRTWSSKCGNFKIVSQKFSLPTASIGYKVFKLVGTNWERVTFARSTVAESLSEAKTWACWEIDPNYEG